jgi:serine/threonine protein phosphatase PrpC
MSTVLSALFVALDAALAAQGHEYVGCTATVVLGWKDAGGNVYIQAANVGDSAAFLISVDTEPMALTIDHRLAAPSERERLTALGIILQVRWMGRSCAMHRPAACLYASMYGTL